METNSDFAVTIDLLLITESFVWDKASNTCCVVIFHSDVLNMLQRNNSDMLVHVTNQFSVNDCCQLGPNSLLVLKVGNRLLYGVL